MTSDREYVRRAKLDLYGPDMIDATYWTTRHGMELVTRLHDALEREEKLREALEKTLRLAKNATEHITEDLQPEFQRLADGKNFSWPKTWQREQFDFKKAAQRLATWWHGAGTEETLALARKALEGSQND